MNRQQAATCYDTRFFFNGELYMVKSARIEADGCPVHAVDFENGRYCSRPTPLYPPVQPRDKRDAEVYRIDEDGIEMFVCWLADAPTGLRAAYVRTFVTIGCLVPIIPCNEVNDDKVFAYAR